MAAATKTKEDSLYRKLSALGDTDAGVAETLDAWVAKQGKAVSRFDIIYCVNQLRKFKKYNHAIQLYEWLGKSENKLNNADRAILVHLLSKTEGLASAEKYFNSLEESAKTIKTYGALLKCYCNEGMLDKATELYEKMREMNHTSNPLNYNNLMALQLRCGHPEKVPLLAQEMEEKNITADTYTYNLLVNSYASLNDFEAVEKVMEKVRTNKVKRHWSIYGNLATVYVNAGLVDKAKVSLEEVEKMENLCDLEAYHTLINLYARISDPAGVNRAWQSLKMAHPKTSNMSYLTMLLALFKQGELDGLEKLFKEWESSCSTYDIRVSNVVLESYLNRDMIEEAVLLYENAVKKGAEPNLHTLDLFMNFYLKKRQMDLALKYLEEGAPKMKPVKWNPDKSKRFLNEETVGMFLKYFEEEKDIDSAEKFFGIMRKVNRLNSEIYDSLLMTYIAAGKVEPQMRQRMNEDGFEISSETDKLLQKVCPQ